MNTPQSLMTTRLARGMTQRQLAEATGISQAMISHIEQGKHSPRVEIAQRIAQALGVATDDITWGKAGDIAEG